MPTVACVSFFGMHGILVVRYIYLPICSSGNINIIFAEFACILCKVKQMQAAVYMERSASKLGYSTFRGVITGPGLIITHKQCVKLVMALAL